MKRSDFFNRLQEEGKLQLVPPSGEIMTSYLKKSDFKIMKEEVEELIEAAEIFNSRIFDFIEKLNSEKIADFRMKMETLLKQV